MRKIVRLLAVALSGTLAATMLVGSPALGATGNISTEIAEAVAALEARYTEPTVVTTDTSVTVTFDDVDGNHYNFVLAKGVNATQLKGVGPNNAPSIGGGPSFYQTTWHWWGWRYWLNRTETYQLVTDGVNAAIIYAIAAALGCTACVVGAAIELGWSQAAQTYYNNGNCIYINEPYQTVGEHHEHGC